MKWKMPLESRALGCYTWLGRAGKRVWGEEEALAQGVTPTAPGLAVGCADTCQEGGLLQLLGSVPILLGF